jgi:hypothetical protein
MLRVLSQPAYRGGMKVAQGWKHVFWGDDYSISDPSAIASARITGTKQVTNVYLIGLACRNGGALGYFRCGYRLASDSGGNSGVHRDSEFIEQVNVAGNPGNLKDRYGVRFLHSFLRRSGKRSRDVVLSGGG